MREIKFRGYNGLEWLYTEMIRYVSEDDSWQMMNHETDEWDYVSFIGQYTGLKDKNGKEIYEGDILKYTNFKREETLHVWWENEIAGFNFGNRNLSFIKYHIEVIGNIYENLELLEVE